MAEEITILDELREKLNRRPFGRFAMVTDDGKRHEVTRAHQVAIGRNTIIFLGVRALSVWIPVQSLKAVEDSPPIEWNYDVEC